MARRGDYIRFNTDLADEDGVTQISFNGGSIESKVARRLGGNSSVASFKTPASTCFIPELSSATWMIVTRHQFVSKDVKHYCSNRVRYEPFHETIAANGPMTSLTWI